MQIRTEEMHRIAEEGIAAHWKYKEGKKGPAQDDQRIAWLRHLVEWQQDMQDPGEFMSTLKVDLYPEEVYTFTPQRPRDRAAARRHAHRLRLRHSLRRRQHLRRRQGQRPHRPAALHAAQRRHRRDHDAARTTCPARTGCRIVKTSRARNKIKHVINASEREKAIEIGQKYLEKEARRLGVQLSKITKAELERVAGEYGYSKIEDLYAGLGYGKFSARQVLQNAAPGQFPAEEEEAATEPSSAPPLPASRRPARRRAISPSRSRAATT